MRNQLVLLSLCVALGGPTQFAWAQVAASLNEESFFVLHGSGEQMLGVQIRSDSGGLMPIPDALPDRSTPFQFLLQNTNELIALGNLGTPLVLDGSVKLNARWNSNWPHRDVEMVWGRSGNGETQPVILSGDFYESGGPCVQCPPPPPPTPPGVSLNDDHLVVLTGAGYELSDITFRSPSNSLLPSSSPAPFTELTSNSPNEVTFASPDSPVIVDGSVTLNVGWNNHVYERDISYDFETMQGERSKTIVLANRHYNIPTFPKLDVRINDDDQFVISGTGQPITELSLSSNAGRLIPGQNPAPFGSFTVQTPTKVTMAAASGTLILDGEVTLDTKWDWKDHTKLVTVSYDLLGDVRDQRYNLPKINFPDVPIEGREPLLITLDDQNNFVITGIGQEINGVEFNAPSGGLTTSEQATAPFPHLLANTSEKITLGVLGSVIVDGSYVMDFGPSDPALLEDIRITVAYGAALTPTATNEICNRCDLPQVNMSPDRGLVLTDFPDPISELRFHSPGGGLTSFNPPEGIEIATSTPTDLVVTSNDGFDAQDMQGLTVAWGAPQDFGVFVSMSLVDGRTFGPFLVGASTELVPEPTSLSLLIVTLLALLRLRRPCAATRDRRASG